MEKVITFLAIALIASVITWISIKRSVNEPSIDRTTDLENTRESTADKQFVNSGISEEEMAAASSLSLVWLNFITYGILPVRILFGILGLVVAIKTFENSMFIYLIGLSIEISTVIFIIKRRVIAYQLIYISMSYAIVSSIVYAASKNPGGLLWGIVFGITAFYFNYKYFHKRKAIFVN